jgi:hypothetical protein
MASDELKKQVEVQAKALPPASLDTLKELRKENCESKDFHLASFQLFLRRLLSPDSPIRSMLLVHGTGVGKCHGIDTPILMYDGSIKMVQDIVVDDLLMGDDSTPRRVLSLARGTDELYKVQSVKGDSYIVNQEHILCLKHTGQNEVTEITVTNFLNKSKKIQRNLKGYSTGVEFEKKEIDFDPYILGVWLGDGSKRDPVISSQDSAILSYLRQFGKENGLSLNYQSGYDYRMSSDSPSGPNVFLKFLQANNLINNKHVPSHFKINSRDVRLQVLAGLIDTDGYLTNNCYEITQKSKILADDIVFIARSLGFATTTKRVQKSCMYKGERRVGTYYRTNIFGDITDIPVKILRKQGGIRKMNKDPLKYGIQVIPQGVGDYYGFTLDGNNRYVLGNFTVTHNTCTAIQVAEEYILRPEFQDKKVLVVASSAVQENFRTQIFDVTRVKQDPTGLLMSQQCTGRRYLEQLERAQTEGLRWENPENREKMNSIVQKMIDDFYDFSGGIQFANLVDKKKTNLSAADFTAWVHETFDGRLLIVDEAHSLREDDTKENKLMSESIQRIAQIANGMTLVFLTATPMFNAFQEIMIFFNIFLWNDKRQTAKQRITANSIFNGDGTFKTADTEATFRGWVHEYVSFIRGENPFTFPFRLPPPPDMVGPLDRETDVNDKAITEPRKYLPLVVSYVEGPQKEAVSKISGKLQDDFVPTIVVSPDGRSITKCFEKPRNSAKFQYRYAKGLIPFLSPSNVKAHAAKFVTILKCIEASPSITFVYSNFVRGGALQFAMCLEEHGYEPAIGLKLLENVSGEYEGSPKGKYAFLTSDMGERQITQLIRRLRKPENANGSDIRVIIGSPLISEGVDFKNVRQVHILDPWYNMSRIEQIIGRGLRTCSHSGLPFEEQNCTVYLHTVRFSDSKKETYDEYAYRVYVEAKTAGIAKVKRILSESAVDCTTQIATNQLPDDWLSLMIPQRRAQDGKTVTMPLSALSAPTFEDGNPSLVCYAHTSASDADTYVRPLSSYLDVRDEIFDKIVSLFEKKELWTQVDLLEQLKYSPEVVTYLVESAVRDHLKIKDSSGRIGTLENRGGVYAFKPRDIADATMFERSVADTADGRVQVEVPADELPPAPAIPKPKTTIETLRAAHHFPFAVTTKFPQNIIDWFLIDQVMDPAEKRDLILQRQEPPPPYAEGLRIDGLNYLVLGPRDIVNDRNEPVEPIGTEMDAYKAWANTHLERIVEQIKTGKILCTTEKQTLKIAPFVVSDEGHIQRAPREKTIRPKECGFYHIPELKAFAKDVTGQDFPAEAKKKDPMCMYLSLAARTPSERIFWVQPEIWAVLSTPEFAGLILSKLKASKTDRE